MCYMVGWVWRQGTLRYIYILLHTLMATTGLRRTRNPCSSFMLIQQMFGKQDNTYITEFFFYSATNPSWWTSKTATIGTKCALPLRDVSRAGISMDQPVVQVGWVFFYGQIIITYSILLGCFFSSEEWHQCDMVGRGWKLPLANSFFFVFFESLMFFELNQL